MTELQRQVILWTALLAIAAPAKTWAQNSVRLVLNYIPTADHAPYYYAKAQGWYQQAGVDAAIEVGKGSAYSAQAVGSGAAAFGIADLATAMVRVSQRAFAACVADAEPCLEALMAAGSGLDRTVQHDQWQRIKGLMRSPGGQQVALGAFDLQRVASDDELVRTYIGLDAAFTPDAIATNALLDPAVKLQLE